VSTRLRKATNQLLRRCPGLLSIARPFLHLFPVPYTIRPVDTTRDLAALTDCAAALSGTRPDALRESFRQEFAAQHAGRWLFLVAVEEGKSDRVLGFVRVLRQNAAEGWWIAGLGVRPLYRRRGIGEALLRAALVRLQESGVGEVRVSVSHASRPAIALYRKLGFTQEQRASERRETLTYTWPCS
jgi:ribosomal protein S18 acetylase RimI-like enzyme